MAARFKALSAVQRAKGMQRNFLIEGLDKMPTSLGGEVCAQKGPVAATTEADCITFCIALCACLPGAASSGACQMLGVSRLGYFQAEKETCESDRTKVGGMELPTKPT